MRMVRTVFRIGESVLVHSAPAEVFAFVADLRNFPLWRANLATSTVVSDQFTDVGARCEEEIAIGPRSIPATCQITSFDAGRTFSFRALSPGLQYDGLVTVEPEEGSTRFTARSVLLSRMGLPLMPRTWTLMRWRSLTGRNLPYVLAASRPIAPA